MDNFNAVGTFYLVYCSQLDCASVIFCAFRCGGFFQAVTVNFVDESGDITVVDRHPPRQTTDSGDFHVHKRS